MSVMTLMSRDHEWTVDDIDAIPDDGLKYELIDGQLLVSPAPVPVHQRAIGKIWRLLHDRCPDHLEVFGAPLDWRPDRRSSLQPDVLVVRVEDEGEKNIEAPLLLAVEVMSPSSRRTDRVLKRSKYEDAGVTSYWIVDPDEPSIEALDLVDGRYQTIGRAVGEETVELALPFPIIIRPADLIRR